MAEERHHGEAGERSEESHIEMPAPTFWPMVFAFGIALLLAGMVTNFVVSIVGLIIAGRAAVGWWHDVIPKESHEEMAIDLELRPAPILVEARSVVRLKIGEGRHRVRIPEEIHPYSAGFWGGLAGGAAMAGLACLYGLIAQHSIWYPVNLLAAAVIPDLGNATLQQLRSFNELAFFAALIGHGCISILVGVVYAVMLPMFPKYAPFWAGILMPLFWSGLVATTLNIVNPAMNARISWPWFVACQLGFGLVGGYVIARSTSIRTMQSWSLAERAFLETPGGKDEK
ncbi:MAG TPA: hypothetical protein VGL97_03100 [Bryobacteraceae bacterium]|jgi:hypothetical protein